MTSADTDPRTRLGAAGLRATQQRIAVLESLQDRPHSTADVVAARVRARLGTISTQAVYDALAACARAGLVRRIEPAGHSALFETRTADNHHHMVCRGCGDILDVDCAVGEAPCLTVARDAGFSVDEAEIVFWGSCPRCSSAARPAITTDHQTPQHHPVHDPKEDRS